MNYIGIVLILILPMFAGTVFNIIFKQKETSQSETYLTGFFSLFLLQGVIFAFCTYLGQSFEMVSWIFTYCSIALILLGFAGMVYIAIQNKKSDRLPNQKMSKDDWIMLAVMTIVLALIILRVILLYDFVRTDVMLETVRVNAITGTINKYNPLTGHPYELGIITSKKIITLPAYYTYWCIRYGIEPRLLLYVVITIQTVYCVMQSCYQNALLMVNTKKKHFTILAFVGILILSGDYFNGAIGYKILWNGYSGETIVSAVGCLYMLYLGFSMYKFERGELGTRSWKERIAKFFRMVIVIASSVFLTNLALGAVLLIICLITMIICCTIKGGKEVEE